MQEAPAAQAEVSSVGTMGVEGGIVADRASAAAAREAAVDEDVAQGNW